MPTDLPPDAERALSRRLGKAGINDLSIPLGDGWMQRAGRGSFFVTGGSSGSVVQGGGGGRGGEGDDDKEKPPPPPAPTVMEVETAESNFYLITYDQTPDAHVTKTGHYSVEASMRAMAGASVREPPYAAIALNWQRNRSSVTSPSFLAVAMSSNAWRIEYHNDGKQSILAEVRDSTIKPSGSYHKVRVEVRDGNRLSLHVNQRPVVETLLVPPPPSASNIGGGGGGGGGRGASLTGSVGLAVFRSRMQVKRFTLSPLEPEGGGPDGSGRGGAMVVSASSRPQFTGGDPKLIELIEGEMLESSPRVEWDSIGGLSNAKALLNEAVVLPLIIPDYFAAVACRSPWKGVLLFGPPGTGKTLLARAVASLGKTAFFNISASSVVSKYHGESEKLIKTLFALARHHAPSVIFFDEVDALVSARGAAGEHEASRRLKSELLTQMDGVGGGSDGSGGGGGGGGDAASLVMVLATSNKPWDLDEAMRRRLERRIYVPLPDETSRKEMWLIHLKGVKLSDEVFVDDLARRTEGYSGADIQLACRDLSMMPMRRSIAGKSPDEIMRMQAEGALEGEVKMEDIDTALSRTQPSTASHEHVAYEQFDKEYGCK